MQRVGGEAARRAFVYDDDARAGADLPATCVVYPIHRILVHQEECVTVLLNTGLQPIRRSYGAITTAGSSVNEENPLAPLRANDEPGFHYVRKYKDGGCFGF